MAKQLGPIDVLCDAPPYIIVLACDQVGFQRPADVRWCRRPGTRSEASGWQAFLQNFVGTGPRDVAAIAQHTCSCGHRIPELKHYRFITSYLEESSYLLAQCSQCHTIYWDEI